MKLGLGTVQLGLDYGIANKLGKPDRKTAFDILGYAYRNRIVFFDTAAAYGDSEVIIGDFIVKSDIKNIKISTKGKAVNADITSKNEKNLEKIINEEVEKSLKNLRLNKINFYLLHNINALEESGAVIARVFEELKDRGIIEHFGVSVYDSSALSLCLEYDVIDVVQLPFNILDTRLSESGMLEKLKNRGIEIHARSIYLQGALLMDSEISDVKIPGLANYVKKLRVFAENMNLTVKQLAFLFVRGNEWIDRMLVGCESLEQIDDNIKLYNMDDIDRERVTAFVKKEFSGIAKEILNPSLWKL